MSGSGSRPTSDPRRFPLLGYAGPYVMLGWQIALGLVVFVAIGYALDVWLDTLPWFLIGGVVLGVVSIFTRLYRVTVELQREDRRRKRTKSSGESFSAPESDLNDPRDWDDDWEKRWEDKWDDRWPDGGEEDAASEHRT